VFIIMIGVLFRAARWPCFKRGSMRVGLKPSDENRRMTKLVAPSPWRSPFARAAAHLVQLHPGRRVVGDLHRRGGGAQSHLRLHRLLSFAQLFGLSGASGGYASALTVVTFGGTFWMGVFLGRG